MNKVLIACVKILFSVMVVLLLVYGTVQLCRKGYDYGYRMFADTAAGTEAETE